MRTLVLLLATISAACAGRRAPPPPSAPPATGAAAGTGPSAAAGGETRTSIDLDGDGRPEVWRFTRAAPGAAEIVLRQEADLNGDGRVDTWERHGPDGALEELVYDMDFDGRPDATLRFRGDELVSKEYAFGTGGAARVRSFHENGVLVRVERDEDGDGRVDAWEQWEGGRLVRVGTDGDGDGRPDRWEPEPPAAPDAPRRRE